MLVKALKSFSGLVTMSAGDLREITDNNIVMDLLNAKYIEEVKTEPKTEAKPKTETKKAVKKKTPKGG